MPARDIPFVVETRTVSLPRAWVGAWDCYDYAAVDCERSACCDAAPLTAEAVADPTTGEFPLEVSLDVTIGGGVAPYSVVIDWGDGTTETVDSGALPVTHEFVTEDDYEITVTVTDACGTEVVGSVVVTADPVSECLLDTFTGAAGTLNGHAPDLGDVGAVWVGGAGLFSLSGSGNAVVTTSAANVFCFIAESSAIEWEVTVRTPTTAMDYSGDDQMGLVFGSASADRHWLWCLWTSGANAGNASLYQINSGYTLRATHALPGGYADATEYVLGVSVLGTVVTMKINGTTVGTYDGYTNYGDYTGIEATGFDGTTSGAWWDDISAVCAPLPGASCAEAAEFAVGDSIAASGLAAEVHWWTVPITSGSSYHVTVTSSQVNTEFTCQTGACGALTDIVPAFDAPGCFDLGAVVASNILILVSIGTGASYTLTVTAGDCP